MSIFLRAAVGNLPETAKLIDGLGTMHRHSGWGYLSGKNMIEFV
jgi:hypothetical protein